ncbi:hypothetical protein GGQ88_003691 [Novosphingobium hassiacum]|uniref:Tip attachment protein J domain-containing protein n=1 Tax=Novosphingobium hassiacum TaxID=173676 RepID=A0A7W5ZZL0_9SPHN|nr:phage tail protein [Novosphingobium hassiacum]MBB3862391.1 hypothetical protein [Novosphingobium hassiacum]
MATLVLSAAGTIFGGPIGGAIGALIGRQIDASIVGGRKIEGPRLKELAVQTSSYGSALPMHFGTVRASGTVIWATELIEHKEKSGGGKGRPSVTNYSYTVSFAVAVASRPIAGIGRIWADGNLLRGDAGDLKVGGTLRIHSGHGDQAADPLLAQAEGADKSPAYRNVAYVVFEDLELADYGNRLPSLTLEIIADDGSISLAAVVSSLLPGAATGNLTQSTLSGFSVDQGAAADVLATLSDITPLTCSVVDEQLSFGLAEIFVDEALLELPVPTAGGETAEDARADGWSRRRDALPGARQCAVRYYDIARDYQPGLQRSLGRSGPGDVTMIELPAAMAAGEARELANKAAQRFTLARDTMRYRIAEIDQRFGPGAIVRTPITEGVWRIDQWEWQSDGVMLDLSAVQASLPATPVTDAGRSNHAADLLTTPTRITAFELPWDGQGDGASPMLRVAATAQTAGWTGAALYTERADASTISLGSTGRRRAIAGVAISALPGASPLLVDTVGEVEIELASSDFSLDNATWAQLVQGANMAVLGDELIQFARADFIGGSAWRLSGLLRGRGGTEHATAGHIAGEGFALIDDSLIALDVTLVSDVKTSTIVAIGLGDATPATSPIGNPGLTLRPLAPVHGRASRGSDGALTLEWVRRSRGSWTWLDEVDVPLNESAELWEVTFGATDTPARYWQLTEPRLTIPAVTAAELAALGSGLTFTVRQVGRQSRSLPLRIAMPA